MDLTQLANLGEFIGGVAVLVTLGYLALQVRQSNELARADAIHKAVNTWSAERRMRVDDSVSDVLAKAHRDEDLSPKEEIQLRGYLSELTYSSWAAYTNERFAANAKRIAPDAVARQVGRSAAWRAAWAEIDAELRDHDLSDFADEVNRRIGTHL